MKKIFCAARSRQWPIIFFAPLIRAHDEKFDRLAGKFILHALEKIVVPVQRYGIFVKRSLRAKIYFSDFSAATSVSSDDHQQMLAFARTVTAVHFDAQIVAQ